MSYSILEFMRMARCGELTWLCCIDKAHVQEIHKLARTLSVEDLLTVHELACFCSPPGLGPGPKPQPNPGGDQPKPTPPGQQPTDREKGETCLQWAMRYLCSPVGRALMAAALTELRKRRSETSETMVKALCLALEAAIIAAAAACGNPAIAERVVRGLCKIRAVLRKMHDTPLMGSLINSLGDHTLELLLFGKFSDILDQCCDEIVANTNDLPDWATALDKIGGG